MGRSQRENLKSDCLLLVEGKDEVNLFETLIERCLDGASSIQVIDAGGKDRFSGELQAIRAAAQLRPTFRAIGVVRDADDNAAGAFKSVCDHLGKAGYEPPSSHGKFSDAAPSVGVFIVPDGANVGAMETLCRRSVQGTDASACVEKYMECLDGHDAMKSRNRDKTFAHAYLSAGVDPVARVGEGARNGVWDFESDAFGALKRFVRNLSTRGA